MKGSVTFREQDSKVHRKDQEETVIPLIIRDVEHFVMCLLAICISSLKKYLFRSFDCFSIELLIFLLLSCISC